MIYNFDWLGPIWMYLMTKKFVLRSGQLNGTMIPTYLDHVPESSSTRTFVHYAQLHLSKNFEAYDFGETGRTTTHLQI